MIDALKIERACEKIETHAGAGLVAAITAADTIEVILNADGTLWVESFGKGFSRLGCMEPAAAMAMVRTVAGVHNTELNETNPLFEGEFPLDGSRFAAQVPPVVAAPTFSLRKRASNVFRLEDYEKARSMSCKQLQYLRTAIDDHKNILISGGTGSGKTTLANGMIAAAVEGRPMERFVVIEDTGELRVEAANHVKLQTAAGIGMTDLLRASLRMRPDRILIGEVRGAEARDMLMAWNTGHPGGIGTIHADSARKAISRLEMLVSMHPEAPRNIEQLIAETVDVIVQIERELGGRRITEIIEVIANDSRGLAIRSLPGLSAMDLELV